jgi:subtilase family serine protease
MNSTPLWAANCSLQTANSVARTNIFTSNCPPTGIPTNVYVVCVDFVGGKGIRRLLLIVLAALGVVSTSLGQTPKQNYLQVPMSFPKASFLAQATNRLASSQHLSISVSLDYRDPAGMQQFVESVSDPKSSNYRHFITPAEIGKRFGPSPATIEKVRSYLANQGMSISLVADNGLVILADATVQQAEAAFQTKIYQFASSDGYVPSSGHLFSFAAIPSVPADIQPLILHIGGLENFTHPVHNLVPLTPPNIQSLYDVSPMYSAGTQGQGRTIAISSWDGYRVSNVAHEYATYGLPTPSGGVGTNITIKPVSGGCGTGAEAGEADLDIQSILGVAPLCNLIIYDGGDDDLIGVLTLEANDNLADVISESYGWELPSSMTTAAHNLHLSMTAEGITYMAASGDHGTTITYCYPDIEPEVLSVGGTEGFVNSNGTRAAEYGWAGSGGGWVVTTDSFNKLPSYQVGTGVPTNINYRLIPDVALNADPYTGYEVFLNGAFEVIGGTSGASPTFAGSLGVSEQQLISNGALAADQYGHQRLGRLQDVIYSLNGDSSVFYDITVGSSNGTLPNGATANVGVGWDFVTGWGAMDFSGFVAKLSGTSLSQFSLSPTSVEGRAATVTGTLSLLTAAPTGGTAIAITGGDSSVSYPTTVTVPAGSKSATFSISNSAVSTSHAEALVATVGSNTKSATLTVTPTPIASLVITPGVAVGAGNFSGVLTLLHAAPSGGDVVTLSGGDSSISHPSSVTVAAGATTATFSMTSLMVATTDLETITATLSPSSKAATVTLTGLKVTTLSFSPTSVTGGTASTGTITLSAATGTSGVPVSLSGGDSSVGYPATVTVPAHATSATFKITTTGVVSATVEDITATLGSAGKMAALTINSPTIASMTLAPTSVFGGVAAKGAITLSGPAPSSGVAIAMSGGDSHVTYPSSVTVAGGATTATYNITSTVVLTTTLETLKATLAGKATTAVLTLKPEGILASLGFSPNSIIGGKTSTGTLTLTAGAGPTGVTVTVTGGNSSISYSSSVSIPAGMSSKTFVVSSSAVSTNVTESLTATLGPSSSKGALIVTAPTVASVTLSPATVLGGASSTGKITLTGVAPTGGLTVKLSGGNSSVSYPATVSVAAGATTATFTVTTSGVAATTSENLTAKAGTSSSAATLSITAATLSSVTFSAASTTGGSTVTGTVTLTGPAGPSGAEIKLTGGNASVSYPATVTVAAGAKTATFTITSSTVVAAVIEKLTATLATTIKTINLTVEP